MNKKKQKLTVYNFNGEVQFDMIFDFKKDAIEYIRKNGLTKIKHRLDEIRK